MRARSAVFLSWIVAAGSAGFAATPARELAAKYCVACHNETVKSGNVALDKADTEHVFNSAETWEKVIVKLRSGSMPPVVLRRRDNATYDALTGWLEMEVDSVAQSVIQSRHPRVRARVYRPEHVNA